MKKVTIILVVILAAVVMYYGTRGKDSETNSQTLKVMQNETNNFQIIPISHASLYLKWQGKTILTDPTGASSTFSAQPAPDIILVTDIHGDHFSTSTLEALAKDTTKIISPKVVSDLLPESLKSKNITMNNGEVLEVNGFKIEAIPMYNVPETADAFHTKGRGNGYLIESAGKRVYIAGDTGNTEEMRALQNIDVAFIPMNLPYTMSVEDAANAVLAFKPKQAIPYHYRGADGLSDINKFKDLVNQGDSNIVVDLMNFYP